MERSLPSERAQQMAPHPPCPTTKEGVACDSALLSWAVPGRCPLALWAPPGATAPTRKHPTTAEGADRSLRPQSCLCPAKSGPVCDLGRKSCPLGRAPLGVRGPGLGRGALCTEQRESRAQIAGAASAGQSLGPLGLATQRPGAVAGHSLA